MGRHKKSNRETRRIRINHWLITLAVLRIALILVPQNGYIHPDEFHQSTEILAGRMLGVQNSIPWEFNINLPIRCITFPYFTTGMVYLFLREMRSLALEYLSIDLVSPYFLIVAPRLLIGFCSFIVDYCLYKICANNKERYKTRLLILSTSYIMLIYGTRTFSNSIELILFAILLYLVAEAQTHTNDFTRKKDYVNFRYNKSATVSDRAKFHKLRLWLVSDTYRNGLFVASTFVFGVFNRPTFLAYGIIPTFFWIFRGTRKRRLPLWKFHTRMLFFVICCIPSILFNVIIDSFFYGYITWGEIGMLDVSINNFVCTPFNFLKYNLNPANLKKHGLHPKYLHLLVNIPLLFGILGAVALVNVGKYIRWAGYGKYHLLPPLRSIKMLMTASFMTPLFVLSLVPHQEPRFLIPIILPLVYLHGLDIVPDLDGVVSRIFETAAEHRKNASKRKRHYQFFKIWVITNCMLLIFFGFVHQGGVYYSMNHLQKDVKNSTLDTEYHIVTSHIYALPESLLLTRAPDQVKKIDLYKFIPRRKINLYEEGSKSLEDVVEKLLSMVQAKNLIYKRIKGFKKYKIYLLISNTLTMDMDQQLKQNEITARKLTTFWPHLSTEALPEIMDFCFNPMNLFFYNCSATNVWDYIVGVNNLFSLTLYELIEDEKKQEQKKKTGKKLKKVPKKETKIKTVKKKENRVEIVETVEMLYRMPSKAM